MRSGARRGLWTGDAGGPRAGGHRATRVRGGLRNSAPATSICSSLNLIGQLASGDRSGSSVGWRSGGDHLLLCERDGVKEGLHRGLAEAPPTLMRPVLVVQQGLRTPTGPVSAKFSIDGIRGLAWPFMSMRRSRSRMAVISVAR